MSAPADMTGDADGVARRRRSARLAWLLAALALGVYVLFFALKLRG